MANAIITRRSIVNGGSVNYMTRAQWDAMDISHKEAAGLTLIGTSSDPCGVWYNYSDIGKIIADFESPILSNMSWGTSGIDEAVTVSEDGYYLVLNYESVGEAGNTHRSGASTSTTGTMVWKDTHSLDFDWSLYRRDLSFDLALMELEVGDEITLSNSHSNNFAAQAHLIVKIPNDISVIPELVESSFMERTPRNTQTFISQDNGCYLVLTIDNCPNGNGTPSTIITHNGVEEITHYTSTSGRSSIYIGEYVMIPGQAIQMTDSTVDSYATKTFISWLVQPTN